MIQGPPRSILLVRLGGLGDLLAVLPSIRFLRQSFSECRLTLVCREEYGVLFERAGLVQAVEPESGPRFSKLFSPSVLPDDVLRSWTAGFDLILAWVQGRGDAGRELKGIARRSGLPALILAYDPQRDLPVARDFFEATVRTFAENGPARPSFEECFFLPIGDDIRRSGLIPLQGAGMDPDPGLVVIHPGAGSRAKRWPVQNFLSVAGRLSAAGRCGLVITGEAESELKDSVASESLPKGWRHLDRPDLTGLAGLLSQCALYIGNDSGVTHLAAACGARVLALFRREFEAAWQPGGRSTIISADRLDAISPEDVLMFSGAILASDSRESPLHQNLCKKP